jgi:hypothetical protein
VIPVAPEGGAVARGGVLRGRAVAGSATSSRPRARAFGFPTTVAAMIVLDAWLFARFRRARWL